MEKNRNKNVNSSRVTHSVDPAVIEENAKKAPDGDALYREVFAKKLNRLLEEKQIDQKTLAAKTKISETNISNYRNATTTIKLPALVKIARELGVSVDYLSGNSDIESINLDVQDICKKTGLSSKAVETLLYFKKKDILPDLTRLLNHITCDLDCILIGKDICRLIDDVKTASEYEENSPYALENFFINEGTPVDGVNLRGTEISAGSLKSLSGKERNMTIKEYREGKGMTQVELASVIGVPQANVSRWESGAINPSVGSLRKLATVFGCQIDDITPAVKKLKAKDIFTREAYDGLTAEERRKELKKQQAAEYSGWRRYPTTMSRLMERIPAEWWDAYTAQHIGEVMAMLKIAFDDGISYGGAHPDA